MGSGIGWRCTSCGAEKTYLLGGSMGGFNSEEVLGAAKKGRFGEAVRHLISGESLDAPTTFEHYEWFRCPSCDEVFQGRSIELSFKDGCRLRYLDIPACPSCCEEMYFDDDREPLSEGDLHRLVEERVREGCPSCGGHAVEPVFMMWD